MHHLTQDLSFAARMLRTAPAFNLLAVLTLALGIGANSAIFSVADALIWKSLPYAQPQRLVMVMDRRVESDRWIPTTSGTYLDWAEQSKSFELLAAYRNTSLNLTSGSTYSGDPERLSGALVTADFFPALGKQAALGRTIATESSPRVAVLSHGLWQRSFGAAADIVGKTIQLDGQACTIAGVMPPDFHFPAAVDIWMPLVFTPQQRGMRYAHGLFGVARLKATVSRAAAQAA